MRTEKEILEQRARVHYQMQDLLKRAKDENRAMTSDEDAQWNKADEDFRAYTSELERVRILADRSAEMNRVDETPAPVLPGASKQQDPKAVS